jgi:hypothetical protein
MSQRVYLINRHKKGISQKWLHIFCTTIVLSTLDYCYSAWGNLPSTKYKRIDLILLRAANLILPSQKHNNNHRLEVFEKVNWLSAAERYEHYVLTFVNTNIINKSSLTKSWTEFFVKIPESDRVTQNHECFCVPSMNTEYGKKSFVYQAMKMWNSLPLTIKMLQSPVVFESNISKILLELRKDDFLFSEETRIINANCS